MGQQMSNSPYFYPQFFISYALYVTSSINSQNQFGFAVFFFNGVVHRSETNTPHIAVFTSTGPKANDNAVCIFDSMILSKEQIDSYHANGYLVLPAFSSKEELQRLKAAATAMMNDFDPKTVTSIFSTKNQADLSNAYFLESANGIGYFFEEGAVDDQGNLTRPKEAALNKIGHAFHDLVPEFRQWTRSHKVTDVVRSLGYKRPLPVQSMLIFKHPGIGGEVVPHQDSTFLATDPPSVVGLWLALEDATVENGCLWGLPGSHKQGVMRRFIRSDNGKVHFEGSLPDYGSELEGFEPIEVAAGSLVILHGTNVHASKVNESNISRHAFSVHVVEGSPDVKWLPENWLQRKDDFPFEPLYDDVVADQS